MLRGKTFKIATRLLFFFFFDLRTFDFKNGLKLDFIF